MRTSKANTFLLNFPFDSIVCVRLLKLSSSISEDSFLCIVSFLLKYIVRTDGREEGRRQQQTKRTPATNRYNHNTMLNLISVHQKSVEQCNKNRTKEQCNAVLFVCVSYSFSSQFFFCRFFYLVLHFSAFIHSLSHLFKD